MKTISNLKNNLTRTAMLLLMVLAKSLTASATDFITDVMVAGNKNQSQFNTLIGNLEQQGWTDISQDLNQGCGTGSDYIHLLYKKQSSSDNTGTPITDFFLYVGNNHPSSLTHEGRTYYLIPYQGSDSFTSGQGDLNNNAGGAYIHLYYTKDALSNNKGVTAITFNTTQSGAVGENGGSTGYDLNAGCGSSSAYIYMHLTTASGGNVVTLSSGSGEVQLQNGHILTGTGGNHTHVTITDGATVTLNGVNITSIINNDGYQWAGLTCLGDATIVLGENTTNSVKGGFRSSGIYVPISKTLTLQGNGTLNATGTNWSAGIGSSYSSSCGNITISGGNITANGGASGAGIGSCNERYCGNIIISGGTVTANGGDDSAGIGSGEYHSACGNITISGGTVTANGSGSAAGIGSGYDNSSCGNITITNGVSLVTVTKNNSNHTIGSGNGGSTCGTVTIGGVTGLITQSPFITFPYAVAFSANGGTGTMNNQSFMYNIAQNLTANSFSRTYYSFEGWATSAYGPKVYNDKQKLSNLYAKWIRIGSIPGEMLLCDGDTLTGLGGINTHVSIADSATVIFNGVDITAILEDDNHKWPGITCLGDAVIVLAEDTINRVKGGKDNPGIYVPQGHTLTLRGSGTLNVTGGYGAAGIGSGNSCSSCGNITINGGKFIATGGDAAAGIGSGHNSSCDDITISGGDVFASGGYESAGIGSGEEYSSCGNITISGGEVAATGGDSAVGIGSGNSCSSCGNITISGGEVAATGDYESVGIGSGRDNSSCDNITINGGKVIAIGGDSAVGIGNGLNGSSCGNINITNGVTLVTATAGQNCNNAIGAVYYWDGTCGTVTIGGVETGFITLSPFVILPKDIAGYSTGTGGWHLIASPLAEVFTPTAEKGFLTNTYDLYRFNQAAELEWENWKTEGTANYHFNLESGRGYLYANSENDTLVFTGVPYAGNGQVALTKTAGAQLEGWNLIGNPSATAKTIAKPFYRMNALGTEIIAAENNIVEAMEGIFMVADTDGEVVTFTDVSRTNGKSDERIVLNLSGPSTGSETAVIDRAIIRFGEGQPLPKHQIHENSTKIYIPQDDKEYAVVNVGRDEMHCVSTEIPIHFKAAENGVYTFTISGTFHFPLSTLHLIDDLTGTDIDLLQTPSYTFTATTHDDASRFRLVFKL